MTTHRWRSAVLLAGLALGWLAPAWGQDGIEYTPGRPWSAILPNPEKFDWNRQQRPGYRYRGMLPLQQRFYNYIQARRRSGAQLTGAEQMMIRYLQGARRWPEAPRPNRFWTAYINYLRSRPTDELTYAERLMLSELFARGLCPMDTPPSPHTPDLIRYLNSGPFEARNWFQRIMGRVEPWLEYEMAAGGIDMSGQGAPPTGVFPVDGTFNGLRIWYNVTGATLGAATDRGGFTNTRTHAVGTINATGTLSVTGRYSVGGFGADITVVVWADAQRKEYKHYLEQTNKGGTYTSEAAYSVSVPIPAHCKQGGFSVRLDGRYSMGGGHRGLIVSGTFKQSASDKVQEQSEEDAKWRAEVERTLKNLGYEDTPEGKELKAMRAAAAAGGAAWRAFCDRRARELGPDRSPEGQEFGRLKQAMAAGGDQWNQYAQKGLGSTPLPDDAKALPDVGGLKVGTSAAQGQVQGAADHFDQAPKVSCALDYKDLPAGTPVTAVWTRDGQEVARSERQCGGSGWVSFGISAKQGSLAPGAYVVTIAAGGKVLGRKSFTIGQPSGEG